MNDDYITKKDLEVFGEKLEQKLEQKLEPMRQDINKIGVFQEEMMGQIKGMAEMLVPSLERGVDHDSRIKTNEEMLNQHDIQIKSLIK
jgi:hypothetical protein